MIPTTTVLKIQTIQMIAASDPTQMSVSSTELGGSDEVLSRRSGSFWDDEEDY